MFLHMINYTLGVSNEKKPGDFVFMIIVPSRRLPFSSMATNLAFKYIYIYFIPGIIALPIV